MMTSDRIEFGEEPGARIEALRSEGIICFAGNYTERVALKYKPNEPFTWKVSVVDFHRVDDGRILEDKSGRRFIIVTIPAENRGVGF
jgi:hypothetical protein